MIKHLLSWQEKNKPQAFWLDYLTMYVITGLVIFSYSAEINGL